MHAEIERRCSPRSSDFARIWQRVPRAASLPPEEALINGMLGESWMAEEAVASALYCYWCHPEGFRQAVLAAVNTDGDSDSIACIAGSIVGARWGIDAIPESWRREVEDSTYLHALGHRLWQHRLAKKSTGL